MALLALQRISISFYITLNVLYSFVAFYWSEKKGRKRCPLLFFLPLRCKANSQLTFPETIVWPISGDWLWLSVSATAVVLWRWKFDGLQDEKEERGEIWFHWQLPYPSSLRWAVDTARPFWTSGRKTNRTALNLCSSYCCLSSVICVVMAEGGGGSCGEHSGHCVTEVKLKEIDFSISCKYNLYTSALTCDRQHLILSGRVPANHWGFWKTIWGRSPCVCVCAHTHVGKSCVTPRSQFWTWLCVCRRGGFGDWRLEEGRWDAEWSEK